MTDETITLKLYPYRVTYKQYKGPIHAVETRSTTSYEAAQAVRDGLIATYGKGPRVLRVYLGDEQVAYDEVIFEGRTTTVVSNAHEIIDEQSMKVGILVISLGNDHSDQPHDPSDDGDMIDEDPPQDGEDEEEEESETGDENITPEGPFTLGE